MRSSAKPVCDLFVLLGTSKPDVTYHEAYGDTPPILQPAWLVCCRNPLAPRKCALPVAFASCHDAQRAMLALIGAGLDTGPALHQRIKVERDWDGVRRIMIEALAW